MAGPTRINAPQVPDFVEHRMAGPVTEYLRTLTGFIQREFLRRPEANTALDAIYLTAPNGSVYSLTVSNAGAAVFTLVAS